MGFNPKTVLAGLAILLAFPPCGMASIITFQNRSIPVLLTAGPQTEDGFTYEAKSGAWEVQAKYGSPGSALATFFNSNTSTDFHSVGDRLEITRVGGGTFTFDSVDFATKSGSGSDDVLLTGLLGGSQTDTLAITASTGSPYAFQPVTSGFTDVIDLLRVEITYYGYNALFLDNINLTPTAVPEPTAFCVWGVIGLCLLGCRAFRGRNRMKRA